VTTGAGAEKISDPRPDEGSIVYVERERFEDMVGKALDALPPKLGEVMRNVAVTVDHDGGPPGLLGLYRGFPSQNGRRNTPNPLREVLFPSSGLDLRTNRRCPSLGAG